MSEPHELVITRLIDAPRERLFQAWTDPAQLAQWWAPHGMTTSVVEMELRPGGIFHTTMRAQDGTEYPYAGVFLEIVENSRIAFTDTYRPGWIPAGHFMTAIVTFEDEAGQARYTARALHWSAGERAKHEAMGFHRGWGECLDQLVALVTR